MVQLLPKKAAKIPVMDSLIANKCIRKLGFHATIFGVTGNVLSEDEEVFFEAIDVVTLNQHWEKQYQ